MDASLIELRWLDKSEWLTDYMKSTSLVLQYRTRVNVLEVGLHEVIWSDWEDVPTAYANESRD